MGTVIFLPRADPELARAWERLGGDAPQAADPESGEVWQYMGTEYYQAPDPNPHIPATGWYHSFHHRHHPFTQQREYARPTRRPETS